MHDDVKREPEITEATPDDSQPEELLLKTCFRVASKCCSECLFGPHKLVSNKRKEALIEECLREETFFRCHMGDAHGHTICCRGFFEVYGPAVLPLRLVHALNEQSPGSIRFVDVEQDSGATEHAPFSGEQEE